MDKQSITGIILAGGQARRMGGQDKGLLKLANKTMIEYILDILKPQLGYIVINANRNLTEYARYGYPVTSDLIEGFFGPLAGMMSGIKIANTPLIATVPCDTPLLPEDLIKRLYAALIEQQADISVVHTGERLQPVVTLMKTTLLDSITEFLQRGERKIDRWFASQAMAIVDFSDQPSAFININTEADMTAVASKFGKK